MTAAIVIRSRVIFTIIIVSQKSLNFQGEKDLVLQEEKESRKNFNFKFRKTFFFSSAATTKILNKELNDNTYFRI